MKGIHYDASRRLESAAGPELRNNIHCALYTEKKEVKNDVEYAGTECKFVSIQSNSHLPSEDPWHRILLCDTTNAATAQPV
jgi:hypothetical protein